MTLDLDLSGRTALVTGSTRGIGRAIAQALAKNGAEVLINGRSADGVAAEVKELTDGGLKAQAAAFDVADRDAARNAIQAFERIDILINNAGIIHRHPLTSFSDEDWQHVLDVNLTACFQLARDCAPAMIAQGWGRIVNIASIMGMLARPTIPPYVSTKHGLIGLTKALAVELGPHGITSNAINPGYIDTDINEALINDPEFDAMVKRRTPVGRWGQPEEIAGACVFLAADAGAYVNGTMITIDGGLTAAL